MDDELHPWLVDSHPERAGRGDYLEILVQEAAQHLDATRLVQAGVVRRGAKSGPIESAGKTLGGISGGGVDDGQPVLLPEESEQPLEPLSFIPDPDDAEPEIGPVE